ncbi:MAG: Asp-tRNA(Asn)/Glu-tRNA(Gln) amidotransferase subunit GatC [Coriobacteriia bacterium]|nr:Asp-tRNA(Asn)/Glu-tRNA(Gln) amidotransferase subunit GatC [Coriobacteriia bacterium]
MSLTEKQVRQIAFETRIALSDDEVTQLTADLNQIITASEVLSEFDLTDVEPTYHPLATFTNIMREDTIIPSMSVEDALANAASHENGQYKVPTILTGEEEQ